MHASTFVSRRKKRARRAKLRSKIALGTLTCTRAQHSIRPASSFNLPKMGKKCCSKQLLCRATQIDTSGAKKSASSRPHLSLWPRYLRLAAHGTGSDFDCFSLACCCGAFTGVVWLRFKAGITRSIRRTRSVVCSFHQHCWADMDRCAGRAGNWSNICLSKWMAVLGGHVTAIPAVHTFADCPSRNGLPLNGA